MEVQISTLEKIAEGTLLNAKESSWFGSAKTRYTYRSKLGRKCKLRLKDYTDVTHSTAKKGDKIFIYRISGEFIVVEVREDLVSKPKHTYIGPASEVKSYF